MPIHAIAPSPVARLLLELEARGATGGVDIGGRRIVLTKGAIVEVRPASDDASLVASTNGLDFGLLDSGSGDAFADDGLFAFAQVDPGAAKEATP